MPNCGRFTEIWTRLPTLASRRSPSIVLSVPVADCRQVRIECSRPVRIASNGAHLSKTSFGATRNSSTDNLWEGFTHCRGRHSRCRQESTGSCFGFREPAPALAQSSPSTDGQPRPGSSGPAGTLPRIAWRHRWGSSRPIDTLRGLGPVWSLRSADLVPAVGHGPASGDLSL